MSADEYSNLKSRGSSTATLSVSSFTRREVFLLHVTEKTIFVREQSMKSKMTLKSRRKFKFLSVGRVRTEPDQVDVAISRARTERKKERRLCDKKKYDAKREG